MNNGMYDRARQAWRQQAALADAELRWMLGSVEAAAAYWRDVFAALSKEELRALERYSAAALPKKRPAKGRTAR